MKSNRPHSIRSWRQLAWTSAVGVGLVISPSHANADNEGDHCRFFSGPFSSTTVPVPPCTSPVGLCTHGMLQGDFPAQYDFTFATLQSAGDPNDPTEFVYTGHSVVTTKRGVIQTNDSGVIHIPANGAPAPFVTTAVIASGTERYVGATGVFVASGQLTFATGNATGSFIAQICPGDTE